jgi:hypothetical protein
MEKTAKNSLLNGTLKPQFSLKKYTSPTLEKLGDLRSLTLGVSGGTLESGNAGTHHDEGLPFFMSPG